MISRAGPDEIEVFVVDDHPVVREGLRAMLDSEPDIRVVGEAGSVEAAADRIEALKADMLLIDLQLGADSGVRLVRYVHERWVGLRTIVVSQHLSPRRAREAISAGAIGYVCKEEAADHIIDAVRSGYRGRRYLSPNVARV